MTTTRKADGTFSAAFFDLDNPVHYRFSRRLGEQVPDATYAQGWEGPTGGGLRYAKLAFWTLWLGLVLAVAGTILALA
jgi:hypothetical protein